MPARCLLVLVRGCNQPFLDQPRLIGLLRDLVAA
jgi:hypothetical protein